MIEEEQKSNKRSTIIVNNNKYLINEDGKTVSLVKWVDYDQIQIIPRSINYQSKEYIITNILEKAFYLNQGIKSVEFSEDSELVSISNHLFYSSSIKSLFIPASLEEFEDGWCNDVEKLSKVTISIPLSLLYPYKMQSTKSNFGIVSYISNARRSTSAFKMDTSLFSLRKFLATSSLET